MRVYPTTSAQWSGVPETSIPELVRRACERYPDRPAIIFEDGVTIRRDDLQDRIERLGGYLASRLRPTDRVAIMLGNRVEWIIAYVAILAVRGVMVPVNPDARPHDAGYLFRDSGARYVVTDEKSLPVLAEIRAECPDLEEILVVDGAEPDGLARYDDGVRLALRDAQCRAHDLGSIHYTSGSTGVPKGCMGDHAEMLRYVDIWRRLQGMEETDRALCCLQFFYGDSLWLLLTCLHSGTTLVAMRKFSVSRFWNVVQKYHVTQLYGIGAIPSLLLAAKPSPAERNHVVKFAVQVAIPATIHQALIARFGCPWVDAYGLSESGPISWMPMMDWERMVGSGSMGLACPEVSIRIVGEDGSDLESDEVGELIAQTPSIMDGYYNKPEATAEVIQDGWLHTGDLARRDEEGFVYFVGRRKDIIRRGGENISAAEVEEVLRLNPLVSEAACVPVSDTLRGEEVKAYIYAPGERPTPESLVELCAERLAPFKVPRYIEFRDTDFPRTPTLRIKKTDLKEDGAYVIGAAWDRDAAKSSHT